MAARRLVIVMLVLLTVSTLAAALVPTPESDPGPRDTTGGDPNRRGAAPQTAASAPSGGRLVREQIRISNRQPPTIVLRPGDQLQLQVSGSFGDEITIPGFGLTETMTRLAPASFDLIVDRAGRFPIRAIVTDRLVGRIKAAEPKPKRGRQRD